MLFMKKKYQLERFFVTWLMILFMILTDAFTAFAQVKQATFLVNGISCDLEQGIIKSRVCDSGMCKSSIYGGKYVYRKRNGCLFATCS